MKTSDFLARSVQSKLRSGKTMDLMVFGLAGTLFVVWLLGHGVLSLIGGDPSTRNPTQLVAIHDSVAIPESPSAQLVEQEDSQIETEGDSQDTEAIVSDQKNQSELAQDPSRNDDVENDSTHATGVNENQEVTAMDSESNEPTSQLANQISEPIEDETPANSESTDVNTVSNLANEFTFKDEPATKVTENAELKKDETSFRVPLEGEIDGSQTKPVAPNPKLVAGSDSKQVDSLNGSSKKTIGDPQADNTDEVQDDIGEIPLLDITPKPESVVKKSFPMRKWISARGSEATLALVRVEGNFIVVKDAKDREFTLPFSKFSQADQDYAKRAFDASK